MSRAFLFYRFWEAIHRWHRSHHNTVNASLCNCHSPRRKTAFSPPQTGDLLFSGYSRVVIWWSRSDQNRPSFLQPLPNGKSCQSEPPHGIMTRSHSVKHSHRLRTKEQITQKSLLPSLEGKQLIFSVCMRVHVCVCDCSRDKELAY